MRSWVARDATNHPRYAFYGTYLTEAGREGFIVMVGELSDSPRRGRLMGVFQVQNRG